MSQTLIAVFDDQADALKARGELVAAGFSSDDIEIQSTAGSESAGNGTGSDDRRDEGGISGFFRRLFGMDEADRDVSMYTEAWRRGSCIVSVQTDAADELQQAEGILQRCGAVDIDERAAQWQGGGWPGAGGERIDIGTAESRSAVDAAGRQTIPVVEEQMQVGKRQVLRGGVRVYARVREQPVEQSVQLREEHASVQRRAVNRSATDADLAGMKEGTIEISETAEEPVVAKQARVVEEVEVGKQASQRTETVRGTVRKTEVQVEDTRGEHAVARGAADDAATNNPAAPARRGPGDR